jgi:superoxide dismutase, Cu-Zn family
LPRYTLIPALALSPLALAACQAHIPAADAPRAAAELRRADGTAAGSVTATAEGTGIRITLRATGMQPGERGVHVHMTGACEAPGFASAGGHWNPGGAAHGLEGAPGHHAGDMPNLVVGSNGTGEMSYTIEGASLAQMMDADGAAFVVHAERDDQMTDPSGNSGARIACGVFAAD